MGPKRRHAVEVNMENWPDMVQNAIPWSQTSRVPVHRHRIFQECTIATGKVALFS